MIVDIRVRPHSSRNKVAGLLGTRLIVAVQAPAVDGKANQAVTEEVAKAFEVRARDVVIVHGALSRDKRVEIAGDEVELTRIYDELTGGPKLL